MHYDKIICSLAKAGFIEEAQELDALSKEVQQLTAEIHAADSAVSNRLTEFKVQLSSSLANHKQINTQMLKQNDQIEELVSHLKGKLNDKPSSQSVKKFKLGLYHR